MARHARSRVCGWFAIGDTAWLDCCEATHLRHCPVCDMGADVDEHLAGDS